MTTEQRRLPSFDVDDDRDIEAAFSSIMERMTWVKRWQAIAIEVQPPRVSPKTLRHLLHFNMYVGMGRGAGSFVLYANQELHPGDVIAVLFDRFKALGCHTHAIGAARRRVKAYTPSARRRPYGAGCANV